MVRQRTIKPDFWVDPKTGTLSLLAQTTFIGTWNLADDKGVCRLNCTYIKGQLFPYNIGISPEDIKDVIDELSEKKLIVIGSYNEEDYFLIKNFLKHQKIDKPGKPLIPLELLNEVFSGQFDDNSTNVRRPFDDRSTPKIKENKISENKEESSSLIETSKVVNDDDIKKTKITETLTDLGLTDVEIILRAYSIIEIERALKMTSQYKPANPGAYFRCLLKNKATAELSVIGESQPKNGRCEALKIIESWKAEKQHEKPSREKIIEDLICHGNHEEASRLSEMWKLKPKPT